MTTQKSISADRSYIDYTRENFGIRVWRDRCQAIACEGEEWLGREQSKALPLDPQFKNLPVGTALAPVPAISFEIGVLGCRELDRLTAGELSFDDALVS